MIDTIAKLKAHLKLFKSQALKAGATQYQLYPMFYVYFDKNKHKYSLSKPQILDLACEILIEE